MTQRGRPGPGQNGPISASLPASSSPSQPSASSEAAAACSEGGEGSQLRPLIEVTPEMIAAGMEIFTLFDEGGDDPERLLSAVFRSMYEARAR